MNLLEKHEQWLKQRVDDGEITESSKETYLVAGSGALETLLAEMPEHIILAWIGEIQTKGHAWPTAIRQLKAIAEQERSGTA